MDLLRLVASRAWWVDPGPEARQLLIEAARRLGDASAEDPRVFAIHAYADPVGHAQDVLARLRAEAAQERLDTDAARFFGPAALVVGAFDLGNDFLRAAVDGLRDEGRLGHLPRLLSLYSCMAARRGDWEVAITAGEEARRLAGEFAEPQWAAAADTAISLVAAPAPARSIQLEVVTQERYKLGVNRHSTSFTVGAVLECGTLTYRSVVSPIRTAAGLRVSEDHFSHP